MELVIKSKNIEVSEHTKRQIEKKIGKLERYLDNVTEAIVELSEEATRSRENRYVVQVTLNCQGTFLRGEERAADLFTALDAVAEVMNRQIRRYKGKFEAKRRRRALEKEELMSELEQSGQVVKRKRFPIKPMSVEEAIDQMELLGHDFFLFLDEETEQINVVYRRKGGDYGLLQPEVE